MECKHYRTILSNYERNVKYCCLHDSYIHNYTEYTGLKEKCRHCNKALTEGDCIHEMLRIRTTLKAQRKEAHPIKSLDNSLSPQTHKINVNHQDPEIMTHHPIETTEEEENT